jgi:hypothetical protein
MHSNPEGKKLQVPEPVEGTPQQKPPHPHTQTICFAFDYFPTFFEKRFHSSKRLWSASFYLLQQKDIVW